ncbi:MAG: hypothetical protein HFJ58_04285 [Clostridia bacterium]|nr:hypothetical protein [Clostridia bacterium]
MIKKLNKATICIMMALVILTASFATTSMTARAADPFWGAAYHNPGTDHFTVKIDVTSRVSKIVIKTWDFTGDVSIGIDIFDSNGTQLTELPVIIGQNKTTDPISIRSTGAKGTYRLECYIISGNAGGWVGAWVY